MFGLDNHHVNKNIYAGNVVNTKLIVNGTCTNIRIQYEHEIENNKCERDNVRLSGLELGGSLDTCEVWKFSQAVSSFTSAYNHISSINLIDGSMRMCSRGLI